MKAVRLFECSIQATICVVIIFLSKSERRPQGFTIGVSGFWV